MKGKLTKEENLKRMLEKDLFNEENLTTLKRLTNEVSTGKIPAKELREAIINSRGDILDKLLTTFEFYARQISTQDQLSEFTSGNNSQMTVNLQEKNELLEKVADKVNHIYEEVKKKLELSV